MSSEAETVVRAQHLAKAYKLYKDPKDWVKQQFIGSHRTPYYKSFWALKDISFEVKRGQSLGIIGRNGCGKSTLLQIVCGMTRPTKGEIWVKGRVAPVLALGATFDQEATGRENVLIGGAVLGLKRQEILAKFASITDFAGIGEFMDQPLKLHSAGELVTLCKSAIWIEDGRIREAGDSSHVARAYRRSTYLEQDNMNRFSAV